MRKKDIKKLVSILRNLTCAQKYLLSDDTLVCKKCTYPSTTLHYTNELGDICYSVDKYIGSELAMLHTGITELTELLQSEKLNG